MTEPKTPPPGKVWVTFETDQAVWDDPFAWDPKALVGNVAVKVERGQEEEDPSDKCNRLLKSAEERYRNAAGSIRPDGNLADPPSNLAAGAEFLADALKVLREEL